MSVFEPSYSLSVSLSFEILEHKVVLGQYLKPMTHQVKAEFITINLAVVIHICITAIFRQLVMAAYIHDETVLKKIYSLLS